MADIIDDAQNYNELYQKVALDNFRLKNKTAQFDERFNGKDCVECGDPIPEARIAMYKVRCTPCQEDQDKRAKQFAQQ